MIKTIGTAVFIFVLIVPAALGQRRESTAPPDFYVHTTAHRSLFYADESIGFAVMKRANKKTSRNCRFGSSDTVEVLRNGKIIKSFTPGPVSRLGMNTVRGVQYASHSWNLNRHNFSDSEQINADPNEVFQIRATCGDEVSEPSRPFRFSEWMEPVDGLQVFATPLKRAYKVGEPIRVRVRMRNVGRKPRRCPVPFPEDSYLRSFWSLGQWLDSRPAVDDKFFYSRSLRVLKPGQSRTAIFVLNVYEGKGQNKGRRFGTEPGKYLVSFSVFFQQDDEEVPTKYRRNLWRNEMDSNRFEIVIE